MEASLTGSIYFNEVLQFRWSSHKTEMCSYDKWAGSPTRNLAGKIEITPYESTCMHFKIDSCFWINEIAEISNFVQEQNST